MYTSTCRRNYISRNIFILSLLLLLDFVVVVVAPDSLDSDWMLNNNNASDAIRVRALHKSTDDGTNRNSFLNKIPMTTKVNPFGVLNSLLINATAEFANFSMATHSTYIYKTSDIDLILFMVSWTIRIQVEWLRERCATDDLHELWICR